MRKTALYTLFIICACTISVKAQYNINFNKGWNIGTTELTTEKNNVTLPRAWNEAYAYRVPIERLPDARVSYTKSFHAPKEWKGKKVFVEFEGARQSAEVFLNGKRLGLHQNGVMAFGFDLTPYIKIGKDNLLEVRTDNDWGYKEKNPDGTSTGINDSLVAKDGNSLPNNGLKAASFQWNNKNFNANYGGLPKNVRLHIVPYLYQTLPLYSSLGTTGVYVYAKDFDIRGHSATIHAESQVKNETGKVQEVVYHVDITEKSGKVIASFDSPSYSIGKDETITLSAERHVEGLHFWSWGYGYLYNVTTSLLPVRGKKGASDVQESSVTTVTGFRKTAYEGGQTRLNDRTIMMHGYAQRTSNEWPGVGMSVPAWLSDYSNGLMVESGGNLVRWMHVCPWKQDIESCDRVGLIQAMPAGDAEKDVTGRHWEQRVELMRDAIIYNRNNPSILFYECGNKGISEEHMVEMKAIRDEYDPMGGRAIGCREMLNVNSSAEYGGEMLYINKSGRKPVWAMEYCRDEALRRYWDDWSPSDLASADDFEDDGTIIPGKGSIHKHGAGPLYRNADASSYNQNNDLFAVEMVRRWYDYWMERPGMGSRVSNGGTKIVFSDTNTHNRGESNYRTSGVVDAMRIPKDAFYVHRAMWNGWVTPDSCITHIVGHWNYHSGVTKPVYVVSEAPVVRLFRNGKEVGRERVDYHFLHTFDSIGFEPGLLTAVSYDARGDSVGCHSLCTAGKPHHVNLRYINPTGRLVADGADMGILEFEVVDSVGLRCPLANNMLHFSIDGPAEWIGGIAHRDSVKWREEWEVNPNCIRSLDLPVECGVNRALIRSSLCADGDEMVAPVIVRYTVDGGLAMGEGELVIDGALPSSCEVADASWERMLRGETPLSPSYSDEKLTVSAVNVVAGCNQVDALKSVDDSEDTEWKNDGRASTAWIRYEFEGRVRIDEVVMKLTGWRQRSYPLEIFADSTLVWSGMTPQSLGYVHLNIERPTESKCITIRLKGAAKSEEAFGQITELAAPVANELDLFRAKDGDRVRSELRIVECDFLRRRTSY